MSENYFKLPKYKKEKIYLPYRCPHCYKILRMKIFTGDDIIKYNCQCNKEWFISFNITYYKKVKKLDSFFKLRCSKCGMLPNKDYKYLKKCSICNKIFCMKKTCEHNHSNNILYNLNLLDVTCIKHSKDFIAYCKSCDKDLCEICLKEEKNHNILYYKNILPNKNEFINKYNIINKFSENFVSSFKGVKRVDNYILTLFFHFREIIRTIFFNFSRFSKYNKFNFALISNFLENSDFTVLDINPKIEIVKYIKSPTSFIKSSKYHFDFLENKNNTKLNFFKSIKISYFNETKFIVSSPNKKYFLVDIRDKMIIYDSKTFLPIITQDHNSNIDKYAFQDNKLICNFLKTPKKINIFNITPDNNVLLEEFNSQQQFTNIQFLKDSFLIQNKNIIQIFQDKGPYNLLDTIKVEPTNKRLKALFGYGENFIYEYYNVDSVNSFIYLYNLKTKNKVLLMENKKKEFCSIRRIDENNLLIEYNLCEFYLYDLENLQIVNNYKFDSKINDIYITDNYFIILIKIHRNIKDEIKIQNIFNSKFEKIYNNLCFINYEDYKPKVYRKISELIFLPNDLLCFSGRGLIYMNNNDIN